MGTGGEQTLPCPYQNCLCFWSFPRGASRGATGAAAPPASSLYPRPRSLGPQAWLHAVSRLEGQSFWEMRKPHNSKAGLTYKLKQAGSPSGTLVVVGKHVITQGLGSQDGGPN